MKIYYLFLVALVAVLIGVLNSCAVQYEGKFGTYTATPDGTIIIEPYYAK